MHIHADISVYVSHIPRAYAIWIALYPMHISRICKLYVTHIHTHTSIHMCVVCASDTYTYALAGSLMEGYSCCYSAEPVPVPSLEPSCSWSTQAWVCNTRSVDKIWLRAVSLCPLITNSNRKRQNILKMSMKRSSLVLVWMPTLNRCIASCRRCPCSSSPVLPVFSNLVVLKTGI